MNKKLYFADQEYKPGMVRRQLTKKDYTAVVGIDVGHGECMAYITHKGMKGDWVCDPLNVTQDSEHHTPSYLAYHAGQILIGKDARECPFLITDIKKEPKDWDKPSADSLHTNREVLRDFIAGLWKIILSKNESVRGCWPENVLITVGCPASQAWTAPEYLTDYVDLVKEATGYPDVLILPESTAAIMTPIYSGLNIDVGDGVAVYDLGSSTIDFTYILMGKVMIMASLRLGGYDIDKAMLREVAEKNSVPVLDENRMEYSAARTKLRIVKEAYYKHGRIPRKESIDISRELDFCVDETVLKQLGRHADEADALLEMILQSHDLENLQIKKKQRAAVCGQLRAAIEAYRDSGEPVYRSVEVKVPVNFTVDAAMMYSVLKKDAAVSSQLEAPYKGLSWLGCVEKFLEKTRDSIAVRGLPCGAVILTGGTGKVTQAQELVDLYFPGKRRGGEADTEPIDTAASVAKGLCLVKGHESHAAESFIDLKWKNYQEMMPHYGEFCVGFAEDKLTDRVWSLMEAVAAELNDGCEHTEKELIGLIQKRIAPGSSFEQQVQYDMRRYVREFMNKPLWFTVSTSQWTVGEKQISCSERIRDRINEFAKDVYQVEAGALPELPAVLADSVAKLLDSGMIEKVLLNNKGTGIAYNMTSYTIDFLHPGFGNTVIQLASVFQSRISAARCADMVKALGNQQLREEKRRWLRSDLSQGLEAAEPLRKGFEELMEQLLEVALGIVLFEIFEECVSL